MVSYLLIMFAIILVTAGICYNVTSDIVDTSLSALSLSYSHMPDAQMDADAIEGGNMVLMVFKYSLMFILIVIVYWMISMAQKPLRNY